MYNFAIFLYSIGVRLAALFGHKKARLMIKGHAHTWRQLKEHILPTDRYVWFHASSLGEFEQGRPIIERIRRQQPHLKILLTFFSPSGYEVRKDWEGAHLVCYLPFDTLLRARAFVKLVHPEMAFFVKYEFWRNYVNVLHRSKVPIYSVSSIFRDGQVFFRWYGWWYRPMLRRFTHFFVQDEHSRQLLESIGVTQASVTGDTRFDRVIDIMQAAKPLPLVAAFAGEAAQSAVLVAGSSWPVDEEFIIPYFNNSPQLKLILAPHVVSESHLAQIEQQLERPFVRYTQATQAEAAQAHCLIIDCYGLLSSIYRYATLAYVGGGFGVGIHNVPEAAVYGIPVLVGPNNKRFREAQALIANGGCREVAGGEEFCSVCNEFLSQPKALQAAGQASKNYIHGNAGAAEAIYESVFGNTGKIKG